MERRQADGVAVVAVGSILLLGVLAGLQLYRTGGPMGQADGSAPLMVLLGPVLMSSIVASVVGGVYVFVRGRVFSSGTADAGDAGSVDGTGESSEESPTQGETAETAAADPGERPAVLEVLPEDERRILESVVASPGLTQIEVRDRSGFSRSKVSQTITDLEERGLLYREPQGRTYRVYPADDLASRG